MTKRENQLEKVIYRESFDKEFVIPDGIDLILTDMAVYGCIKGISGEHFTNPIMFSIKNENGIKTIFPLEEADAYMVIASRVVKTTVVEITPEDYYELSNADGKIRILLKEDCK